MPSDELSLQPGLVTSRLALQEAFGKPPQDGKETKPSQNGIVPFRDAGLVCLFSDPQKSKENGYSFDGWAEEDEQGKVFHYTGTGSGEQVLTGLNGTVLNHEEQELELHLLISEKVKGQGPKDQRYVGRMRVDPDNAVLERFERNAAGVMRRVWVFRLRPVDSEQVEYRAEDRTPPAKKSEAVRVPWTETAVVRIETEKHKTDSTTASSKPGKRTMVRAEGKLCQDFEAHLVAQGHTVERFQIQIAGEVDALVTDLYDVTDNVLYEAKGRTTRGNLRMAVGQLLDYRRHIKEPDLKLAVLLPSEPNDDLTDFVTKAGAAVVYKDGDGFTGQPAS